MSTATMGAGFAVALASMIAVVAAVRYRQSSGATPMAVVALLFGAFAAGLGLTDTSLIPISSFILYAVLWPPMAVAWFAFALIYTGRGPAVTNRTGLSLAGLVVAIELLVGLGGETMGVANALRYGLIVLLFAAGVAGTLLIARAGGGRYGGPRRLPAALIVAGLALVSLSVPATLFPSSTEVVRGLWFAQLATAVAALLVAVREGVFTGPPNIGHFARATLLDRLSDAVLVVDQDGKVLDINNAAATTFGVSRAVAFGAAVEPLVGSSLPSDPDAKTAHRTLETVNGDRRFEVIMTGLSGDAADAYLLRDITEQHTDEQRLDALNRVLRHNLRNDLDAIGGFAERLAEPEAEPAPLADRIQTLASDLSDTGAMVAETERLFARSTDAAELVDLDALVRGVTEATERDADGTVTVDVYASAPTVRTNPAVLRPVVRELVANALTHAGDGDASVSVTVTDASEGYEIIVADRGPGIPERERAVLLDGDESPLRHGSGLGLWLVHIGATRLGGDLTYRSREPQGAAITLRIPNTRSGTDDV